MSSDVSSDELEFLTRNIEEEASNIKSDLLPQKSSERYKKCYHDFEEWRKKNKITSYDESIFLVYFNELSTKFQPSTLWNRYSMVRSVLLLEKNVDIKSYPHLKAFMKKKYTGFIAKKSKVFTTEEISKFLTIADDQIYLGMKVILIFGMFGALRTLEFCNLMTSDIDEATNQFVVSVRDTKNCYPRSFVIGPKFYKTVKKYIALRPKDTETRRFFLYYNNGKCTRQPCGKSKIYETPKNIARFLNLPEPNSYTGHCFRRTSATIVANTGANSTTLKQLGGWRSSTIAEGYVEHSLHNKRQISDRIENSGDYNMDVSKNISGAIVKDATTIVKPSSYPATITSTSARTPSSTSTFSTRIANEAEAFKPMSTEYTTNPVSKKLKTDVYVDEPDDVNLNEIAVENHQSSSTTVENEEPENSSNFDTNTATKIPLKTIENNQKYDFIEASTSKKNTNVLKTNNTEANSKNHQPLIMNIQNMTNVTINYYYQFNKQEEKEN